MSVFTNKPFSRLWRGRSRSDANSGDFAGDAAPPFAELASGSDPNPTAEELARIRYYHSKMAVRDADYLDMDLTHERRRLICAGRLFRTDSTFERKGMYELFVLLFDNYLVITQVTGTGSDIAFQVYKRPIPLDLLRVETYPATPCRKGSISVGGRDSSATFPPDSWGIAPLPGGPREMPPLVIYHDGRSGGMTRLFAESEDVQSTWKSKLEEAILLRQKSSRVFEMSILAREEFLTMGSGNSNASPPPENRSSARTITCATPFVTQDGRALLAIGSAEGLWIGNSKDIRSFCRVLRFPVQQCIVIGEHGLIVILSNGELLVCDLEVCVPKSTGRTITFHPKTLETKGRPYLFRVGKLNGEMWIVAAEKKHLDTIFYVWEAVTTMGPDGPLPQEFRMIHNFYLPVECTEVIFLRTRLCALYNNGFNLVKLPEMTIVSVPQVGDSDVSECKKVVKRCSSGGRPISMARVETEVFILCYDKFGVYVDRYGAPLLDRGIVEWEGQADRASFRFPYVLLFSSSFVEVRHLITGHLTQIIRPDTTAGGEGGRGGGPQTGLRCLCDGRGGARNFEYDLQDLGGSAVYHHTTSTGVSSVELPTTLGAVDLPFPVTSDEWGAQSSSSSIVTQQCVFTLFAPVPPPYSLVEEPVVPYDANSIL